MTGILEKTDAKINSSETNQNVSNETQRLIATEDGNYSFFRRIVVISLVSVTALLEGVNLSLPGPFFNSQAEEKGE